MASNSCQREILRILLIGRTGHGKSSTGNTISESKVFKTSSWSESQTKTSKLSEVFTFGDRRVEVVDTPGIFDTENDHKHLNVLKELIKISLITTPGFHVIAIVLKPERFTLEIQQTLEVFYNWFGRGIEKFACLILTHVGSEREKSEYLNRGRHAELSKLLTKCKNRVACIDNNGSSKLKSSQRRKFMELVFQMDVDNKGECFNNFIYDAIKRYAFERGKVNISKDSMILFRSACQDWSHSYRREVLDTLGIDDFDVPESSTEETVPMKTGNLNMFDENNERIPNEIQQNENSTSFHSNDEIEEINEPQTTVPVASETKPPASVSIQSQLTKIERIPSEMLEVQPNESFTSLHSNGEVEEINEPPTTVPVVSETSPPANVSFQSQHTAIYRPSLSEETTRRRRRRNIDMNTIRENVHDPTRYRNNPQTYSDCDNNDDQRSRDNHNVGDQILGDNNNDQGSRDSDNYNGQDSRDNSDSSENFRREANDNPGLLDRFIAGVQNIIQNAACIVI